MAKDDKEIVSALRQKLADRVGQDRFEVWFEAGTRFSVGPGKLTIESPSAFMQDWLRKNFRRDVEAVCMDLFSEPAEIEFLVDESLSRRPEKFSPAEHLPEAVSPLCISSHKNLIAGPQLVSPQPSANPNTVNDSASVTSMPREAVPRATISHSANGPAGNRRPLLTFADFVAGANNKLAITSAQLSLERPGHHSPLLLHGRSGVGKTHLLEAILAAARQHPRRPRAVYLSAEQFTTYYVDACQGRGLPSFRQKYRGVDLLLIDDVQFFEGKSKTLVELLYTIDTLARDGRQLIFAADRPPAELSMLGEELVARLSCGLVCQLDPPDYAVRLDIVRRLTKRLGLTVPEDVQTLIASQFTAGARAMTGALNRLHALSVSNSQPINRAMAEATLPELLNQSNRLVRLPDIQKAVCDVFGLEIDSLQSSRRGVTVSQPRMLAMFLARKYTRAALSEISHFFNRRSHSTVISANRTVENWMSERRVLSLAAQNCDIETAIRRVEERLKLA